MSTLKVNKKEIESGLEKIISDQEFIMKRINSSSAYRKEECQERIELINKRDTYDYLLRCLGIQSFEYFNKDIVYVEIK